jgi:hypothetical protein
MDRTTGSFDSCIHYEILRSTRSDARLRQPSLILFSLGLMRALLAALCLLSAVPSRSSAVTVTPHFLVGVWRSENYSGFYHLRADGSYFVRAWDMVDTGQWRIRRGHTLELITRDQHGKALHEFITIERVGDRVLYVRTKYQKEVWTRQSGT